MEGSSTEDGRLPLFDHCLLYSYSSAGVQPVHQFSTQGDRPPDNTPMFAFPEAADLQAAAAPATSSKVQSHSFVMTDSLGGKKYGLCRRYTVAKQGAQYRECVVIVSSYPWFSLFSKIVEVLLLYRARGTQQISVLLQDIVLQPFPMPGQAITVTVDGRRHDFVRPDDQGYRGTQGVQGTNMLFSDPDFLPLFRQLDVCDVLKLLGCLLGECRVIMHSANLGLLSSCTQASLALIFPFFWQHLFVPVVPHKMLDMCCAPMPFLFGVLSADIPRVKKLPIEQVVFVDLDRRKFENLDACTIELPGRFAAKLQETLVDTIRGFRRARKFSSPMIAKCFLQFFVDLFGGYRLFMRRIKGKLPLFDEERFAESHSGSSNDFIRAFGASQMYRQWVEERPHLFHKSSSTAFEKAAIDVYNLHNRLDSGDKLMMQLKNAKEVIDYKLKKNFSDELDPIHTTAFAVGKSSVWDQGEREQVYQLEEAEDEPAPSEPAEPEEESEDSGPAEEPDNLLNIESDEEEDDLLMGATPTVAEYMDSSQAVNGTAQLDEGMFGDDIFDQLNATSTQGTDEYVATADLLDDLGDLFVTEPDEQPHFGADPDGMDTSLQGSFVLNLEPSDASVCNQETSLDDILNLI